jgi:hypothetical protein
MVLNSVLKLKIPITSAVVEHITTELPNGRIINIDIARYLRRSVRPRIVVFDKQTPLLKWCSQNHILHAINGGFTMVRNYWAKYGRLAKSIHRCSLNLLGTKSVEASTYHSMDILR